MADCSSNPSSALSLHRDSHSISKTKPKVRIIHVFAPEIIKTDADNFRELVQRLTGKPTHGDNDDDQTKIHRPNLRPLQRMVRMGPRSSKDIYKPRSRPSIFESGRMVGKKEDRLGMWNAETSGGFLNGFEHLDGYVQELVEFPVLLPSDHPHHMATSNSSSNSSL